MVGTSAAADERREVVRRNFERGRGRCVLEVGLSDGGTVVGGFGQWVVMERW